MKGIDEMFSDYQDIEQELLLQEANKSAGRCIDNFERMAVDRVQLIGEEDAHTAVHFHGEALGLNNVTYKH